MAFHSNVAPRRRPPRVLREWVCAACLTKNPKYRVQCAACGRRAEA